MDSQPRLVLLGGVPGESPGESGAPLPLADRDDDDLMLLARGGEREAFAALVRRHQQRILGLAWKVLGDDDAARDAVHNAFLDLLRAVPNYRPQGKFPQFLYRVALNRCRMTGRSRRTEKRAFDAFAREPRDEAHDEVLARERQRDLARSLGQLREMHREMLVLRFYADLAHDEIAAILEIPVGTVKSRLHAALEELRKVHQ